MNHFRILILYAFTNFKPAIPMNIGIMKEDKPKHLEIKKYDTNAPKEPQLFLNSLFLLSMSCGLWSSMRLWSYWPVEKYEKNAIVI